MTFSRGFLLLVPLVMLCHVTTGSGQGASPSPTRAQFGRMPDGTAVEIFTLKNTNGIELKAIGYGGIITSLRVPDRSGRLGDIVLGFDRLEDYLKDHPFFGAGSRRMAVFRPTWIRPRRRGCSMPSRMAW